ncbi:MAG: homocysteine S-methyltransferase family protein [Chloroflexi bacterium]|jgi:5-methyltetrahydrofolate--homocysteine methyltransferase|nr:homocysteine S-methyltransferase family protein [Chloroflexota bacterium]
MTDEQERTRPAGRRGPRPDRRAAAGTTEPVDPARFPDLAARRALGGVARERWEALLAEGLAAGGAPVLADGAMGTMLFAAGLESGDPPEAWNVERPDAVRAIHRAYLDAGSRIVLTNTFGGNRLRLGMHGLAERVTELDRAGAELLRAEVDAAGGTALVAGDIGPSGGIMAPLGALGHDEAVEVFAEQAAALVAGGVDVVWIETMSDLAEVRAAVEAVRRVAPGIPLIATMTFDTRGNTMMGVTPAQAVAALTAWGADAVGGNCGNGPDELIPVIAAMRDAAPGAVLVAKPNAGVPVVEGDRVVYRATPGAMAADALLLRDAGATFLGGCCGSSPAHLAAIAQALARP